MGLTTKTRPRKHNAFVPAAFRRSARFDPLEFVESRAPLIPELVRETLEIALETGSKGVRRSAQAGLALVATLREEVGRGEAPEVVRGIMSMQICGHVDECLD